MAITRVTAGWVLPLLLLLGLGWAHAAPVRNGAVLITDERLALLRDDVQNHFEPTWKAWRELQAVADQDVDHPVEPTQTFTAPPRPDDAGPESRSVQALAADGRTAYVEALAFRMTGDARYGREARRVLIGWTSTLQTLTPDEPTRLAVCHYYPAFIFAADLVRKTSLWTPADETAFEAFLRSHILPVTVTRWHFDGVRLEPARVMYDANWGLLLETSVAAYLDDGVLLETSRRRWQALVGEQISSSGMPLPGMLPNGLYHANQMMLADTLAAEVLANHDINVYDTEAGQRFKRAFDRVVEWNISPEHFPGPHSRAVTGQDAFSYFIILNHRFANADADWLLHHRHFRYDDPAPFLWFTHGAR